MRKNKLLSPARSDTFTQGVVFTNGFAEKLEDFDVYGLVITAKCDIAQKKVSHIHYCPIVSVRNWLSVFGWEELKEKLLAIVFEKFEKCIESVSKSKNILQIESPEKIYDIHFENDPNIDRSAKKSFKKHLDRYKAILSVRSIEDIVRDFESDLKGYVKLLVENKLTGYSFIDDIEIIDEDPKGYIILLREINKIPIDLASKIPRGLKEEEFAEYCKTHPEGTRCLNFNKNDQCYPCSIINAPFLELIMQQFGLLFSRIGVEDVDKMFAHNICNNFRRELSC